MIKSNSKEARNNFNKVIKDYIPTKLTMREHIENFNRYCKDCEVLSMADFIINYECDLPFYYNEQREIIKDCLKETTEESYKYNDEKVSKNFIYFMNRALEEVYKIERVFYISDKGRQYTQYKMI